jgi:hypothetical protein
MLNNLNNSEYLKKRLGTQNRERWKCIGNSYSNSGNAKPGTLGTIQKIGQIPCKLLKFHWEAFLGTEKLSSRNYFIFHSQGFPYLGTVPGFFGILFNEINNMMFCVPGNRSQTKYLKLLIKRFPASPIYYVYRYLYTRYLILRFKTAARG